MENKWDWRDSMSLFYGALALFMLSYSTWLWNDYLNGVEMETSWLIILPIFAVFSAAVSLAGIIDKENI
jgi:hypothetical protein